MGGKKVQGLLQGLEAQCAECVERADHLEVQRDQLRKQIQEYREEKKTRQRAVELAQKEMKQSYEQQMARERRNNDKWNDVEEK